MVEIRNLTKKEINQGLLSRIGQDVLLAEGKGDFKVCLAFLEPKVIQYLNKTYRSSNTLTDVLAFSQKDTAVKEPKESVPPAYLGDVAVCLEQVEKNSRQYQTSFIQELARVVVHGILHLLGYEDEKREEEKITMKQKEEKYLADFFPVR